MGDHVISIEQLGKKYTLRHRVDSRDHYVSFREALMHRAAQFGRALASPFQPATPDPAREEFWALRDVSFKIRQGECVGIIGRNGAGKSTLLKILSRITEPTRGRVRIAGRVASLLEVGTGFHPELTGRENVYLNGAILGMTRVEIKRKFDEIVAFAEVEKFLDTPVKRYSSGMYVRLAFAVAAHLEPEILIVDEVLAVGDATFQKKCLGKMQEAGTSGRTVLFVSHNMSVIQSLCRRCVVLQSGSLAVDDTTAEAVKFYLREAGAANSFTRAPQANGNPTLISGQLTLAETAAGEIVRLDLEIATATKRLTSVDVRLADGTGVPVGYGSLGTLNSSQMIELNAGTNRVAVTFPVNELANGSYFLSLDLTNPCVEYFDRFENCLSFENARAARDGELRVLAQSWRYGALEVPLALETAKPAAAAPSRK